MDRRRSFKRRSNPFDFDIATNSNLLHDISTEYHESFTVEDLLNGCTNTTSEESVKEKRLKITENADKNNETIYEMEVEIDEAPKTDESKTPKSKFGYYFSKTNNSCILQLKVGSKLEIAGKIQARCLIGSITIFGNNLKQSSKVYSLNGFGKYMFHITEGFRSSKTTPHNLEVLRIFKDLKEDDALLELEFIREPLFNLLDIYVPQTFLPDITGSKNVLEQMSKCKLHYCEDPSTNFQYGDDFEAVFHAIDQGFRRSRDVTLVCGGGNVGKSSYLMYLTNRLICNSDTPVLYIDLDPGQSEFTISGCVSVCLLRECVIGPNFTHLKQPEKSLYIGEISVVNCLTRYFLGVQYLLEFCMKNEEYQTIPWIVNTMGFNRGIGYNILTKLISIIQPTRLVEIRSKKHMKKNFAQPLDWAYVKNHLRTAKFFRHEVPDKNLKEYPLLTCASPTDNLLQGKWRPAPKNQRELVIISYFSSLYNEWNDGFLHSALPIIINKSQVQIVSSTTRDIGENLQNAVINAGLVALCSKRVDFHLRFTPRESVYNCLGYGIIRGIDEQDIYVLTPLDECTLANVRFLVHGAVEMPLSLLTKNIDAVKQDIIPYAASCAKFKTTRVPKRSYVNVHMLLSKKT